jgi:hypothetical protein
MGNICFTHYVRIASTRQNCILGPAVTDTAALGE